MEGWCGACIKDEADSVCVHVEGVLITGARAMAEAGVEANAWAELRETVACNWVSPLRNAATADDDNGCDMFFFISVPEKDKIRIYVSTIKH